MANNSLLDYKNKRRDIREILQTNYEVNTYLDECVNFKCLSSSNTLFTLGEAIPGSIHTFFVGNTGGCLIYPLNNDRIFFHGALLDDGMAVESYQKGSSITLYCREYGLWEDIEHVGSWIPYSIFGKTFDETFD